MRFRTENEIGSFGFEEAVLQSILKENDHIDLILDNVMVRPENSCNRDIITKRTNDLRVRICNGEWELFEEGYQLFDADMKPIKIVEERKVSKENIQHDLSLMSGCALDGFSEMVSENGESIYTITLFVEDHTWRLEIAGTCDTEMWDRFLNV